jgi:thiol:disulfide interchange protein DsbD
MVVVERIAGFFLAATVVYLLWVFTRQTTADRVWPALVTLGLLAATLAWAGRVPRSRVVRLLAGLMLAAAAAGGTLLISPGAPASGQAVVPGWEPFSAAALEKDLASGRPVLVDATAAWCATCQVNELAVLDRPDVQALLERQGIVRIRADYTRPDSAIQRWLTSVGRAGLPVYVLYRPGQPPYFFPELLTDDTFTRVIEDLAKSP